MTQALPLRKWAMAAILFASCGWMSAQTTPETTTQEISITKNTGKWTATNSAGTWASQWTSNGENPVLTLNSTANNMDYYDGENIRMFTGQAKVRFSTDYTLSVSPGYEIVSYKFDFTTAAPREVASMGITITPQGGQPINATGSSKTVTATVNAPTAVFNVKHDTQTQSGFAYAKNFQVTVQKKEGAATTHYLFVTRPGQNPFRIPALAVTKSGKLLAFSDYRPSKKDIGFGEVDIQLRRSEDNGKTWSEAETIANGDGQGTALTCGFGDAAVVADRESEDVMMICVAGRVPYSQGNYPTSPNPMVLFVSHNEGKTWEPYKDLTEQVYGLFKDSRHGVIKSMFVGSGKLVQSTTIKKGSKYRIYAPVCARPNGNRVLYTDDFGTTWHVLGGKDALPIPAGDEPKCEELPDGRILLSSRTNGGRLFNIFTYTDEEKGEGTWSIAAMSGADNHGTVALNNACNGEIMILPVKRVQDNKQMFLALQSVPYGPNRSNVSIHFKPLETLNDYISPEAFARNWEGRYQVSRLNSAYSTMVFQKDEKVGFYYEESTYGGEYTNVYLPLTVQEITNSKYEYDATVERPKPDDNIISAMDIKEVSALLERKGTGYPREKSAKRIALETIVASPALFQKTELRAAIEAFMVDEDIEMPIPGNRYTLIVTGKNKDYYFNYADGKVRLVLFTADTQIPASGQFEAVKMGDKFGFKTADGKFLSYPTPEPGPTWLKDYNTNGVSDLEFMKELTFKKALKSDKTEITNEELLGAFYIYSARGHRTDNGQVEQGCWIAKMADGSYDGSSAPIYNDTYSSVIRMIKVVLPLGEAVTSEEPRPDVVYALYNDHFTSYAIKKPGENNIWVANMKGDDEHTLANSEFANPLDLESPYGGWQLLKNKAGEYFLYNIGSKQYVVTPTNIGPCTFSDEPTPIRVEKLEGGFAFNTSYGTQSYFCAAPQNPAAPIAVWLSGDRGAKWVFKPNPNLEADLETFKKITALHEMQQEKAQTRKGIFNLQGQRINIADPGLLPRGLYIVNGRKHLVK